MKQLLRRDFVFLAWIVVALLAVGGAAAAKGSHGQAVVLLQSERSPQAAETPQAQQAEQPEPQQQPEAQDEDEDEAVEDQDEDEQVEKENAVEPTPAPAPTVTTRTFALVGGTATFSCTGNAIALVSAVPNPGFGVETEREDGGTEIKVRFENDAHRSEIRAGCAGGQVVAEEIREENR